jgi:hypothetical protein
MLVRPRVQAHGDWWGTMLKGIHDQLIGDDSEPLGGRSVEDRGLGLDCDRHWSPVRDAVEQGACIDKVIGLCQQPVNGRDRLDTSGGVVESTTVSALRTAE